MNNDFQIQAQKILKHTNNFINMSHHPLAFKALFRFS